MGFNQVSDERYEEIMKRDGWEELEEWRELRELQPILEDKIRATKEQLNKLMLEYGSVNHRKRKIEEKVYSENKDVL